VDDAPWGFAVSHYGRWANLRGTWGWVPGPVRTRAYYAPALVAFVGGGNFQLAISSGNVDGVAWFPLGPREIYRPSYPVSRGYFENINRSNTVVNTTVINNYYNNTNVTNVVYANREVPGAVVAVPTTAFVQSQSVSRIAVRVPREAVAAAPVAFVAAVAPVERSVHGAAGPGSRPPSRAFERPVVARSAPPAAQAGFAAQRQELSAKPGTPLDDATRKNLKPAAAAPVPVVKVVAPEKSAPPTMRPPQVTDAARPGAARGKNDDRSTPAAPAQPGAPRAPDAPTQAGAPSPAALPPAPPAAQRAKDDQRGRAQPPIQAVAPPPVPSASAPQSRVAPPQGVTPPSPARPAEQRGKPEQRGGGEPSVRPPASAPAPLPAPRPAEPKVAPPTQAAPPPAAVQPPPQRSAQPEQAQRPRAAPPLPAAQPPAQPAPQTAPQTAPRAKPEAAAPARQAEPRSPAAAPATPPRESQPQPQAVPKPQPQPQAAPKPQPQPQAAPQPRPSGQDPKQGAGKPGDTGKDSDEQKRDEEGRKQKG
jgi:hypothetical protein